MYVYLHLYVYITPPIPVVLIRSCTTRTVPCKGAAGSLIFRFCINRIGPHMCIWAHSYMFIYVYISYTNNLWVQRFLKDFFWHNHVANCDGKLSL